MTDTVGSRNQQAGFFLLSETEILFFLMLRLIWNWFLPSKVKHLNEQYKVKWPCDKGSCIFIHLNIRAVLTGHEIEITFLCAAELYNQHQQKQTCTCQQHERPLDNPEICSQTSSLVIFMVLSLCQWPQWLLLSSLSDDNRGSLIRTLVALTNTFSSQNKSTFLMGSS